MTSLLRQVVSEILNDVLRWDTVLAEVDSLVPSQSEVTATVIGSPALGKTLVSTLNASERCKAFLKAPSVKYGNHSIENHNHMVSQRSKIAIVGMSGRFPGAKDTEDLWRVLSQGLDVHKEVRHLKRWPGLDIPHAYFHRSPKIALMSQPMSTPLERRRIPALPRTVASLISRVSSILPFFTSLLEKPQPRILCSGLCWYLHMRR